MARSCSKRVMMLTKTIRKTGDWKAVEGKEYYAKDATTNGNAFKQEAVSCFMSKMMHNFADHRYVAELCQRRRDSDWDRR